MLQNSIKVANEVPADMRSNLRRAWSEFSQGKIIYLCFFFVMMRCLNSLNTSFSLSSLSLSLSLSSSSSSLLLFFSLLLSFFYINKPEWIDECPKNKSKNFQLILDDIISRFERTLTLISVFNIVYILDELKGCLFTLCFYHALVQGRRRFGQQGKEILAYFGRYYFLLLNDDTHFLYLISSTFR